jgi:hypothetical protein
VTGPQNYKNWFVQYGVGASANWWILGDAGRVNSGPSTTYSLDTNTLMTASADLRMANIGLALSAGQNLGSDVLSPSSTRAGAAALSVGVSATDDFRLSLAYGRYHGTAAWEDGSISRTEKSIDTKLVTIRPEYVFGEGIRAGVEYRTFRVPAGVHTYFRPEGQSSDMYVGSFMRDVRFHNIHGVVGYSSLDHSRKEKTRFNSPFIDFNFAIGALVSHFDAVAVKGQNVSNYSGFSVRTDLQLGWIYFQRWRSLAGGGFYGRAFYAIDLAYMGNLFFLSQDQSSSSYSETGQTSSRGENRTARTELGSLNHAITIEMGMIW